MPRQPTKFTVKCVDAPTSSPGSTSLFTIKGPEMADMTPAQHRMVARFVEGMLNATQDTIGFGK